MRILLLSSILFSEGYPRFPVFTMHHHPVDKLLEVDRRYPPQYVALLGGLPSQFVRLSGSIKAVIDDDLRFPALVHYGEGSLCEFPDAVGNSRIEDKLVTIWDLRHKAHCLDILGSITLISFGLKIAKSRLGVHTELELGDTVCRARAVRRIP